VKKDIHARIREELSQVVNTVISQTPINVVNKKDEEEIEDVLDRKSK
jgi:hypothetical protein